MKLRIRGNSLRLRLTQGEVAGLGSGGIISDSVAFPGGMLRYSIRAEESAPRITASYREDAISVVAPAAQVRAWAETETVGLEGAEPLAGNASLRILVEKDFRCLESRPGEDEHDNFPNPMEVRPASSCESEGS